MSWYRQYRPTTVSGLHAESVKTQLEQLCAAKTFPHAILLVGPRGAGKTSTARILAAMLNEPTNVIGKPLKDPDLNSDLTKRIYQGSSLAVHELDAASHRGIDDVRALKEQAYLPPQEGKVLVFILDEVHMLTTEAFNALLKLLEEPPTNVVFILATTEEHKVPETIVSRCTVIRFRKATEAEIKAALEVIIDDQKLNAEPEAVDAIIQAAGGSFRDAVKYLETVAAGVEKITRADVQRYLGGVPAQRIFTLIDLVISKKEKDVVAFFAQLREDGIDEDAFTASLLQELHQDLINSITGKHAKYAAKVSQFLLTNFAAAELQQHAPIPFLLLELKALDIIFKAQERRLTPSGSGSTPSAKGSSAASSTSTVSSTPSLASSAPMSAALPKEYEPQLDVIPSASGPTVTEDIIPSFEQTPSHISDPNIARTLIEQWQSFVQQVEKRNSSLAAVLRSANCSAAEAGHVRVEVFYQFHRDQLKQPKFAQILDQACIAIVGSPIRFEFVVASSHQTADTLSNVTVPAGESDHMVQLAQEVFL